MKASMQSTSRTLILNGLQFRVWEGVTEKGVPFIALVNRLTSSEVEKEPNLIKETMEKPKDPDPSTAGALDRLGVGS